MRKLFIIIIGTTFTVIGAGLILRAYFLVQTPVESVIGTSQDSTLGTSILGVSTNLPVNPVSDSWWVGSSEDVSNIITYTNFAGVSVYNVASNSVMVTLPATANIVWHKNMSFGIYSITNSNSVTQIWGWNNQAKYLLTTLEFGQTLTSITYSQTDSRIYFIVSKDFKPELYFLAISGAKEKVALLNDNYKLQAVNNQNIYLTLTGKCSILSLQTKLISSTNCNLQPGFATTDYQVEFLANQVNLTKTDLTTGTKTLLYEGEIEENLKLLTSNQVWLFTTLNKWQSSYGLLTPLQLAPEWLFVTKDNLYVSAVNTLYSYDFANSAWNKIIISNCNLDCNLSLIKN